ncbi:FIST signal transduction protein [Pseudodesulfovibrio tunisiensis]|uniref:FIST signal transduction protein n=1 Tax=Pseudodesulfovibrio tunisiensis TaxID=463192 RepID=UPI001FB24D7D|nr:FIST C-terminal domain-containing protein [Pseudodesulfovibrio tunisiensis]
MRIQIDQTGTLQGLEDLLATMDADADVQSVLVLACAENGFIPEQVDPLLRRMGKPVFGGIFPNVIHDRELLSKGTLVAGLRTRAHVHSIPGLSDPDMDYESLLERTVPENAGLRTMLVLVDGTSSRISAFIDGLYSIFGLEVNYVGGGAGQFDFSPAPCLMTNQGLVRDVAVLAELEAVSGVGVSHGWKSVAGPFKVTESTGPLLHSLDWRPAFDVYREAVFSLNEPEIETVDFANYSRAYPLGVSRLDAEMVVRDPTRRLEDGSLVLVGEIPRGSYVDVLSGNPDSLIRAAAMAVRCASMSLPDKAEPDACLFFDCITRVLFLGDRFHEELAAAKSAEIPVAGACSLGEIANNGKEYLEFYNKTSVVALLEDA